MTTITFEDEDGFTTEWPWPDDAPALANGGFVAIFEQGHDHAWAEAGLLQFPD